MTLWPTARSRDGGVDEIPWPSSGGGRLWLCGKHFVGPDPDAALALIGATTIVCLTARFEIEDRYPDYVAWLDRHSPNQALWFPIPDLHAPKVDAAVALIETLYERLLAGERLLVHCGAGIGRAGTVAVGLLMTTGLSRQEALTTVATHRPMAGPEVGAQVELIDALSILWGRAERRTGATWAGTRETDGMNRDAIQ